MFHDDTTISQEWCPVYPTSHTLQERNPSPALLQIFFSPLCIFGKKHSPSMVKIIGQPWQMRFDYFCFNLNNNKTLSQDYPHTLPIRGWYLDKFHYLCMFIISTCYSSIRSALSLSLKPLIFPFMSSQ